MNVFILCTGRCGSTTFAKACSHFNNYSSSHESRSHLLGDQRFNYPDNHIEADNRLSWLLGRLDKHFGDEAFYVHLWRNRRAVSNSFVRRYNGGIIKAYRGTGIIMGLPESADPLEVSGDYFDTVNENIRLFLKNKTKQMDFNLDNWKSLFPSFCDQIGAQGDLSKCISEFEIKHNASKK